MAACPTPTKRRFPGKASAKAAIVRGGYTSGRVRVYLCACGWWHQTSHAEPRRRAQ